MNFINNINNNEFKYLTNLIFKEGKNKKEAGYNKYIIIPDTATSIDDCAFYKCSSLTSITIPNSVTFIDEWAFYNCNSLTSITIPNSVTFIGYCTFSYCSSLKNITIPIKFKNHMDRIFFNISLTNVNIVYT